MSMVNGNVLYYLGEYDGAFTVYEIRSKSLRDMLDDRKDDS